MLKHYSDLKSLLKVLIQVSTTVLLCFIDGFVIVGIKSDSEVVDVVLEGPCIQNEQTKETSVQRTSVRWGNPVSDAVVDKLQLEEIPKANPVECSSLERVG